MVFKLDSEDLSLRGVGVVEALNPYPSSNQSSSVLLGPSIKQKFEYNRGKSLRYTVGASAHKWA